MRAIIKTRLIREAGLIMVMKKRLKIDFKKAIFGFFFVAISIFGLMGPMFNVNGANAVPVGTTTSDTEGAGSTSGAATNNSETNANATGTGVNSDRANAENTEETVEQSGDGCKSSLGAIGWLVCPTTGKIAEAVDWLYEKLEDILVINPIAMEDGSPIYEIWKYCRGLTNIIFIIFLLVVIYSQITGVGISNYGIKRALPKLIIAAVLVNLSFLICSLAVDVSNIFGNGIRGLFASIGESALGGGEGSSISIANMYGALVGGSALAVAGGVIAFELGAIWMLIPTVLGALVAVASGLITIALRQAVVALLIMISPLAMVAYILPNTENLFKKWKSLLTKMLVFYPMFSLLFGASSLAGFAIITSAKNGFGVLLGVAVQIFPLFFSWSLMRMSGTFLGDINTRLRGMAAGPLATNRAWADSHRQLTKQKHLASGRATTPSLRLMQFISNRRIDREAEIAENAQLVKERGMAYRARRNWRGIDATGLPTEHGKKAYENQARSLEYQRVIERDKNTMNKGLGYLAKEGTAERVKLDKLDARMVNAADMLKVERARGEKIEYENAMGFHNRMEDAVNAHMDMKNGFKIEDNGEKSMRSDYKFHFDPNKLGSSTEMARYTEALKIMEGSTQDVQFAAATAAQGYDTQKKIYESKMQKYFEMTPPTKDVVNRLNELTIFSTKDLSDGKKAIDNIDAIIAGLRILNQRGDTDLLKDQLDNVLNRNMGGGVELGTHASQALASFLMFEVKDNDPALRRFGKYINLETANVYNKNQRKGRYIDYDEYLVGYHVEPDGEKMYAKKDVKKLLEGTSLDNIERTALSNLDDSLKKAYGFDENDKTKKWKVGEYLKRREEIQTAFEPAFLSSSLKWLSGSEQINSGVKFWTGYELKQKKDENGKVIIGLDGEPEYDLHPVWKDKEFAGHEEEVEKYFRRKTYDYFKDQTTGQILNMRTDYREPAIEHLMEMYFEDVEKENDHSGMSRKQYEEAKAEIQTRYGDEDALTAKKKRDGDLAQLKRKIAGEQLRKILDKTGKLEQIYNTRRSGTAINAKDWLRQMLNLDDKNEIYKYLDEKDRQRGIKKKNVENQETSGDVQAGSVYNDEGFRKRLMTELDDVFEKSGDAADPDEEFYNESLAKVIKEFGRESEVVGFYEDYRKNNLQASRSELWEELEKILKRFFADNS